jgi:hypothetical protein
MAQASRLSSKLWIPGTGEERYLNLISFGLVLLLLSLGFDLLKLPETISPDRPPLPQFLGLCALLLLNLVLTWVAARDDYLRFSYGFPRVLITFTLLTASFTGAFLLRGLWDGNYILDTSQKFAFREVLTVLIGGQFASLAFFSTYLLKKGDSSPVRNFKKAAGAIRSFATSLNEGKLRGEDFEAAYKIVGPEMEAMSEAARALQLIIGRDEARFASNFGDASKRVAAILADTPTASIGQAIESIRTNEPQALSILFGHKPSRQRRTGTSA